MTTIRDDQRPRPIKPGEAPRDRRDPAIGRVKAELLLRMDAVEKRAREIEKDAGDADAQDARARKRLADALAEARTKAAGRPLTRAAYQRILAEQVLAPSAWQRAYYAEALDLAHKFKATTPDIDQITPPYAGPGRVVWLEGTCFGPSQGKVYLEIGGGNLVELEVRSWSETFVDAFLNPVIGQVPLRPHYGRIWLCTGDGVTSNVWPIQYIPIYSEYIATWTKTVQGHGGGHADGTFLDDAGMGDPDFSIIQVDHSHSGDGWSEKRHPFASGQSMAQGYHVGVGWFGQARMTLLYAVRGPKGIDPPYFEPLGPWSWIGDLDG